jgi:hypothetical protein
MACTYIQPRDRLRKHSTSGRSHQRFREFFVRNLPECWAIRLSSNPFPASVDADFDGIFCARLSKKIVCGRD